MLHQVNILEYMVACPYHGFGGHEEGVEPIHCRIVPELHGQRCLVLQLKTKTESRLSKRVTKFHQDFFC